MPVVMSDNFIFVNPGQKAFKVASNFTNYVQLGLPSPDASYYLEARIENDQFLVDARLWEPDSQEYLSMANNLPKGPSWSRKMTRNGWLVVDRNDHTLLGVEATGNICHLKGRIIDRDGTMIAEDAGDDFLIHRGPAILGRMGDAFGMVFR